MPQPSPRPKPSARGVEGLAATVGRHEPDLGHRDHQLGRDHQRHAAGQRDVALAAAQALAGQVDGHQRRRTGGVDRQARPAQVEEVRQAVGQHAVQRPGQRAQVDRVEVVVLQLRVVVVVAGDEHAGAAAAQPLARLPGVVERLDGDLEEQPLLRVHALGFARHDAEDSRRRIRRSGAGSRPAFVTALPGAARSASNQASASQRSAGTSPTASVPSRSSCQNRSGVSPPPGTRQAMPTMAIGSARSSGCACARACRASSASLMADSPVSDGCGVASSALRAAQRPQRVFVAHRGRSAAPAASCDRRGGGSDRRAAGSGRVAAGQMPDQRVDGRMVPGQRRRQRPGQGRLEPVAQLHRHQRAQAHAAEGLARVDARRGESSAPGRGCRARRRRAARVARRRPAATRRARKRAPAAGPLVTAAARRVRGRAASRDRARACANADQSTGSTTVSGGILPAQPIEQRRAALGGEAAEALAGHFGDIALRRRHPAPGRYRATRPRRCCAPAGHARAGRAPARRARHWPPHSWPGRAAREGAGGREQGEQIEVGQQLIEQLRPPQLGREHGVEGRASMRAPSWLSSRPAACTTPRIAGQASACQPLQEGAELRRIGDVDRRDVHGGTGGFELTQRGDAPAGGTARRRRPIARAAAAPCGSAAPAGARRPPPSPARRAGRRRRGRR